MRSRHLFQAFAGLLGLALATAAAAQPIAVTQLTPCDLVVACHELRIELRQPGTPSTPFRLAKIRLLFERVVGLSPNSFTVTAQETNDVALAGRLPRGVFVNSGLPWLISIAPAPHSPVKFQGQWTMIVQTDNIDFDSATPTARVVYGAPSRPFADITSSVGLGSYLINSGGGDFGQLVVVSDLRQPDQVAFAAYVRLESEISNAPAGTIDADSEAALLDALQRSRNAFGLASRTRASALVPLDELVREAEQRSGSGIEDRWDPSTGKVSVAGSIRAFAASTRLAVGLATRLRAVSTASFVRQLTTANKHKLQVEVSFPNQVGDLGDSLDISARDATPADLARLPDNVSFPAAFPVVVHVGPATPAARIAFRGPWEIQIVTSELDFTTSVGLFTAANAGSDFEDNDITASLGIDSLRASGKKPKFSEFALLVDGRDRKTVSLEKLDRLQQQLAGFAAQITDTTLVAQLSAKLAQARALAAGVSNKRLRRAIALVNDFASLVEANSGVDIPDVHREGDGRENVAGTLIGGAHSLRLSLTLRLNPEGP